MSARVKVAEAIDLAGCGDAVPARMNPDRVKTQVRASTALMLAGRAALDRSVEVVRP